MKFRQAFVSLQYLKKFFRVLLFTDLPLLWTVFLCAVVSLVGSRSSVVLGFSHAYWWNFFIWQFCHLKLAHLAANMTALFLTLGSRVRLRFIDLIFCSLLAWALGFFDQSLYYGLSGVIFYLSGKSIRYIYDYYYLYEYPFMPFHYSLLFSLGLVFSLLTLGPNAYTESFHIACFSCGAFFGMVDGIQKTGKEWRYA